MLMTSKILRYEAEDKLQIVQIIMLERYQACFLRLVSVEMNDQWILLLKSRPINMQTHIG